MKDSVQRPLSGTQRRMLILAVTGAVILFYLFCAAAVVVTALLFGALLLLYIISVRILIGYLLVKPMAAMLKLMLLIVKSMFLGKDMDSSIELSRNDAPGLYELLEKTAKQVDVDIPDRVMLQMDTSASIRLRGYKKGRGHSTLFVGYDLFVILTQSEFEAVMAHEMAHSKLVQRGHKNFVLKAMRRMSQMTEALDSLVAEVEADGKHSYTAFLLSKLTHFVGRQAARMVAAYSRQDEFAADSIAAQICGVDPIRTGLLRLYEAEVMVSRFSWWDRVVQIGRKGSFTQWLRTRFTPDEEERKSIEERILTRERTNDFDTHPALSDRLATLPDNIKAQVSDAPAIDLLKDPDGLAERLLREIERTTLSEEQIDTQKLKKESRSRIGGLKFSGVQLFALVVIIFTGIFTVVVITAAGNPLKRWNPEYWQVLAVFSLIVAANILLYRRFPIRERLQMPIPPYELWQKTVDSDARKTKDEWYEQVESNLKKEMPSGLKGRKNRAKYWGDRAYEALGQCDYQRALAAATLCLQQNKNSYEGLMSYSIACAYFRQDEECVNAVNKAAAKMRLTGSFAWGLAWAMYLIENWEYAEGYLLTAVEKTFRCVTTLCVLGSCQIRRGKFQEAVRNTREAMAIDPDNSACRQTLVRILWGAGRAKEADKELNILEQQAPDDREVLISGIRINLLQERNEKAIECAERLEELYPGGETCLDIASAFGDSDLDDITACYCQKACDTGFYPQALCGLADIERKRKNYDSARSLLMSSLDVTRELAPGGIHPLNFLSSILQALIDMNDSFEECTSWTVTMDMSESPVEIKAMDLMIVTLDVDRAKEMACRLYEAMHPGQTLNESQIKVEKTEQEYQPDAPMPAGIYDWRVST